jgi:hypothetical protein
MKRVIKNFSQFIHESMGYNAGGFTLAAAQEDRIESVADLNFKPEEIESIRAGFTTISRALEAGKDDIILIPEQHPYFNYTEEDGYESFMDMIDNCEDCETIWFDAYLDGTPGSTTVLLCKFPTMDGGEVKIAVYHAGGSDLPLAFIAAHDADQRLV